MRDEEVPHDSLKGFGVWSHPVGTHGRYDDDGVGRASRESAVPADHADDRGADRSRHLDRGNEVGADLPVAISSAHREHEDDVGSRETTPSEPRGEHRLPALVIRPRGELSHVVCWAVGFKARDLSKVVDGMRGVRGTAPDTQEKQTASATPPFDEDRHNALDHVAIEFGGDLSRLSEIPIAM